MHINSLPDLVLRLIFSKLSLRDLIWIGRVCSLWRSHQMSIGAQVRSLTLLIGAPSAHSLITNSSFTLKYRELLLNEDGKQMYNSSQHLDKRFHLTYDGSSFTFEELLNIFPLITTLKIAIKNVQFRLSLTVPLLAKWSRALKSLKMYFNFNGSQFEAHSSIANKETDNEFANLFKVINSMQSLQHLTLDTDASIFPISVKSMFFNSPKSLDLPILSRLQEFYFKSNDRMDIIYRSLLSYSNNDNLKQIGVSLSNIALYYPRFPQLARKFVYVPVCLSVFHSTAVSSSLKSFTNITKLNLVSEFKDFFGPLAIESLNVISTLQNLTHFNIIAYHEGFFRQIQASQNPVPQLSSIQVLTIAAAEMKSSSVFESDLWAHLFPNVQVIELTISSSNPKKIFQEQELQQIITPFAQCSKLHHVYTRESYSTIEIRGKTKNLEVLKEWILLKEHDRVTILRVKCCE